MLTSVSMRPPLCHTSDADPVSQAAACLSKLGKSESEPSWFPSASWPITGLPAHFKHCRTNKQYHCNSKCVEPAQEHCPGFQTALNGAQVTPKRSPVARNAIHATATANLNECDIDDLPVIGWTAVCPLGIEQMPNKPISRRFPQPIADAELISQLDKSSSPDRVACVPPSSDQDAGRPVMVTLRCSLRVVHVALPTATPVRVQH